jgi:hypothetical protein
VFGKSVHAPSTGRARCLFDAQATAMPPGTCLVACGAGVTPRKFKEMAAE